jgi:membrane-associated protein
MIHLVHMIDQALGLLETSKYALLFLGSYFEGSAAMMAGGLLYRLGHVAFLPMYIALFMGDVLSDTMWYFIGYFGARKFLLKYGRFVNITPGILDKAEGKFHQHHLRILVISKLTMGFGFATAILATAGMLRISFARFLTINILCGIVWVSFLIGIGYYFGNVVANIPKNIQIIGALLVVVLFFTAIRFISTYLAKLEWE